LKLRANLVDVRNAACVFSDRLFTDIETESKDWSFPGEQRLDQEPPIPVREPSQVTWRWAEKKIPGGIGTIVAPTIGGSNS
jgi:hypothetical protein